MKKQILDHYEVNKNTIAILPAAHLDYDAVALGTTYECYIQKPPLHLIKQACLEGGSSYDGRRTAVTYQTGIKHKIPIPVNPHQRIYAFPTHSPKDFQCAWIFPNHVRQITPYILPNQPNQTKILFQNSTHIILPVSYYTIEKQIQRTSYIMMRGQLVSR